MSTHRAIVQQIQGITFAGQADSNHWVIMDGPTEFGGSNAGIRPKELLLLALGGCTGSDVVSILRKKRVPLEGFQIRITAELTDEHPKVYRSVHLEYVFYGNGINPKDVERAIELSQSKYCSVTAMLQNSIEITYSSKIEPSKEVPKNVIDLPALDLQTRTPPVQ